MNEKIEFLSNRLTELETLDGCEGRGEYSHCDNLSIYLMANVAAQRKLIAEYHEAEAYYDEHPDAPAGELTGLKVALEFFVQALSDHVDFPAEWKA